MRKTVGLGVWSWIGNHKTNDQYGTLYMRILLKNEEINIYIHTCKKTCCTLKWFESYLTVRLQFVTYDGIQSDINSVKCGVPQGSILGSLLFIIYMNDLFSVSEFLFTILYADDTCVLMNGKHLEDLITRMQKELNFISGYKLIDCH